MSDAAAPAVPRDTALQRFSEEQARVIRATAARVWVTAAAGSGKTGCLVQRLREHIGAGPGRAACTVAFTFTRKAAQEMMERLRDEVSRHASREAARELDRLNIGTIDSFCNALLREHAIEAGLDPQFEVLDPADASQLARETAHDAVEAAAARGACATWFRRYEADAFAQALVDTADVLRNAGDAEALLRGWRSGPGASFETYSAHLAAAKVAFQSEALEPLRPSLEAAAALFEAAEREQDRPRAAKIQEALDALDSGEWRPEAWALARQGMHGSALGKNVQAATKPHREAFNAGADPRSGWLADLGALEADPKAEAALYDELKAFVEVLEAYLKGLREAKSRMIPRRLDFQDVMVEVLRLAENSESFRAHLKSRLRWVMVDELQDINGLQSRLIDVLGAGGELFGVGDPMQSIYRFRHADVELFRRRLASADPFTLLTNFRSRRGILELVNSIFPRILRSAPDFFREVAWRRENAAGGPPVDWLIVTRDAATPPTFEQRPALAEARVVARHLREMMDAGFKVEAKAPDGSTEVRAMEWSDVAILFRSTGAISTYVKALEEAGIPAETLRPGNLFETVEGRDLLALLRVLQNPRHDVALATVLRSPMVDLADATLLHVGKAASSGSAAGEGNRRAWIDVLRDDAARTGLADAEVAKIATFLAWLDEFRSRVLVDGVSLALARCLRRSGYVPREAMRRGGTQVPANVDAFLEFCRSREPARGDLGGLLERMDALAGSNDTPGEGLTPEGRGVQLLTVHGAKGLEYPVVVVAQMGRDWTRGSRQRSPVRIGFEGTSRELRMGARMGAGFGDPEEIRGWTEWFLTREDRCQAGLEEMRLLYVAMTRARDRLILAGTVKAKDGVASWPDGWGRWMEAALEDLGREGVDPDSLVTRVELAAEEIGPARGERDPGRPLAEIHSDTIAAGEALELEVPDALASAARAAVAAAREASGSVAGRAAPPSDISVKHMARALTCPWRYVLGDYIEHITGKEDRGEDAKGGPAMERGQRIHRFFEVWNHAVPIAEDFERAAELAPLTDDDRIQFAAWLEHPEVARALGELQGLAVPAPDGPWDAPGLRRELNLEWRVGRTRVRGRLDAVAVRANGELVVIDYKTDTPAARRRLEPEYERQTALYAAALEQAGLGRVATRRLVYLRQGEVKDFPWDAGSTAALEAEIAAALEQLADGLAGCAPACDQCPLKSLAARDCLSVVATG